MIVIKENTENRLEKRIETISSDLKGLRAVYYSFSKHEDVSVTASIKILEKYFEGSYLYVFEDRDMVLISNLANLKSFEAANNEIKSINNITDANFSNIYDLEKSFSILKSISSRKISKKLVEKAPIKEQESQKVINPPKVSLEINQNLLKSLESRKKNRTNPEILIIEDDMFSRKLVSNALKKDFRVSQAASGNEGLNSYLVHAPNIVFLDIEMPGINGHEVLKRIMSFDPSSFIVMLSGNGNKDNVMEAMSKGAKGFVAKPFTKEKLYDYINKFKLKGVK